MEDPRYLMRRIDELLAKKQAMLGTMIDEDRGATGAEKTNMQSLQAQIDRLELQLGEVREIERKRLGIPKGQETPGMLADENLLSGVSSGSSAHGRQNGFLRNDYRTSHKNIAEFVMDVRWPELREQRGFSFSVGAEGGFLIPDELHRDILMVSPDSSIVRSRCTVLPPSESAPDAKTGVPTLDHGEGALGGLKVYWIAEGAAKTETDAKLALVELEPKEVAGYAVITDKLLRNDSGAASVFLDKVFREALFDEEDYQCLVGDGVGKPLGILNSPARIEVVRAGAGAFDFTDMSGMMGKFLYNSWQRAVWVCNATVLPELINMVDAGNHRVYIGSDPAKQLPPSLLGIPVVFTGRTPVLGTTGDVMLLDLSYYLLKTGSGPFVSASAHVKFLENKTVVKAFYNVDGSPWIQAPLTLRDGVTEISPFVVLK